jgi:peptide/nickel transport system permease protein
MSEASPSITALPMPQDTALQGDDRPRSLTAIVLRDTFARFGARFGAAWVAVLIVCAVFSPFIANSFPIIAKIDGFWQSPLLLHLTPADAVLLIVFFVAIGVAFLRHLTAGAKLAIVVWWAALAIPLSVWAVLHRDFRLYITDFGKPLVFTSIALMTVIDVLVLVLIPIFLKISNQLRIIMGVLAVAVALLLIVKPILPPAAIFYERYREMGKAGSMTDARLVPIPYSPTDRLRDQPGSQLLAPSSEHWMGTEINGSDVLSRMIHASRVALAIGFIATGIAVVAGCIIGGFMGYFSGRVDILGMRLIEVFEAIPTLFLLITCVAVLGRNLYIMMVIIGLTSWSGYARFVRAEFLHLRTQDFVQAAIAAGLPLRSILFRHMLPNGMAPVLVSASFGVASAILAESVLSFLGLGLVDEPSWGDLLSQATGQGGAFTWWLAVFPGAAIFLTVFSYNLIGEALRDALDPKLRATGE